jgi:hypothetical protein
VKGDLYSVDVASKQARRLDAANGYAASGESYLPNGERNMTFVPTVLPIAVGGYFWVLYTSHRSYGNTLDSQQGRGKLWVSALDMSPAAGADASHPGFFLEGQALDATNLRAFWVLDPCRPTGTACDSGDQCCEGFCRTDGNGMACVPPPSGCSNESESCAAASDCCDTTQRCINGHCAVRPPR